jgi:transcriptional regulator with XRE-family HTH domain
MSGSAAPHRWLIIGAFVRERREAAKQTIAGLATAVGMQPEYITRLEAGDEFPPIQRWERLGAALGFDPAEGIRIAAESIPPLTPESRARIFAAVDAFIERQRVFLRAKREARGLTYGDVAAVVGITPTEAEDIEHGRVLLIASDTDRFPKFSTLLGFTFEEWMNAASPKPKADDTCTT